MPNASSNMLGIVGRTKVTLKNMVEGCIERMVYITRQGHKSPLGFKYAIALEIMNINKEGDSKEARCW